MVKLLLSSWWWGGLSPVKPQYELTPMVKLRIKRGCKVKIIIIYFHIRMHAKHDYHEKVENNKNNWEGGHLGGVQRDLQLWGRLWSVQLQGDFISNCKSVLTSLKATFRITETSWKGLAHSWKKSIRGGPTGWLGQNSVVLKVKAM